MPSVHDHDEIQAELIDAANPQLSPLPLEIVGPEPGMLCWVFINNVVGGFGIPAVTGIKYGVTSLAGVFQQQDAFLQVAAFELVAPTIGTQDIQVTLSAIGGDTAEKAFFTSLRSRTRRLVSRYGINPGSNSALRNRWRTI